MLWIFRVSVATSWFAWCFVCFLRGPLIMSTLSCCFCFSDVDMLLSLMVSKERHVLDENSMTILVFLVFHTERASLLAGSVSLVDSVLSF